MSVKSILCIFEGSQNELNTVNSSLELARIFSAQVRFLHISQDPNRYVGVYDGGIVAIPEFIDSIEKGNKQRLEKAKERIVSFTNKHHVPLDTKEPIGHHASAQFINKTGYPDDIIGKEGIASDIIVLGHNIKDENITYDENIIAALFNTGRPVLLLPSIHEKTSHEWDDKVISIAWDGSMESARAIFNSMPILERAEKLYLLTACKHGKINSMDSQHSVIEYLLAHGLKPNYIMVDCENHSTAGTILKKSKELNSNLLVMGAYGHSRFREIILGGFTKHMLEKADIPLLLSH